MASDSNPDLNELGMAKKGEGWVKRERQWGERTASRPRKIGSHALLATGGESRRVS